MKQTKWIKGNFLKINNLFYFSEGKHTGDKFYPFDKDPDGPLDVYNGKSRVSSVKGKSHSKKSFLILRIGVVTKM